MLLVIVNLSRIIHEQQSRLQDRFEDRYAPDVAEDLAVLRRAVLSRVALYNKLAQENMLVDGMIVNRYLDGRLDGLCDSLMFSSLRYFALANMGFKDSAQEAWTSITASRRGGQWLRHPQCQKRLSRDMVMGVMVALRAIPIDGTEIYRTMLTDIDRRWGFVGNGPFYVSWLSPGIAGLLRMEAERRGIGFDEWPWILKQSFSSIEYDTLFLQEGYVSHLAALGLWLEMEHAKTLKHFNPRSLLGAVERLFRIDDGLDTAMDRHRRQWIAGQLRTLHPNNLFYRWLDHEALGTMSDQTMRQMLQELLSMTQFPAGRLPMNCDRRADYVWQRKSSEFHDASSVCTRTYSGVDFLWMAALLGVKIDPREDLGLDQGSNPVAH
jgi:hypothetical protein